MHSHTMWSGDCTTTPDEILDAVRESAIDVLCVTDHNATDGAVHMAKLLADSDIECDVIVGEELRVGQGELIGLFLTERIAPGLNAIDAAKAIRDQGGIVYVPHPFDPMRNCLQPAEIESLVEAGLVDAMEAFNAKTSLSSLQAKAAEFARANDLAAGAGSDAHVPAAFGAAFVEMPHFDGAQDFLANLRRGTIIGHHCDPVRPWSPRIVPSVE